MSECEEQLRGELGRLRFTLKNRERELGRLREQRAGYEQTLELLAALLAALCVRAAEGGELRLPRAAVRGALGRYAFAAAEDGADYVLSFREREGGA